MNEFIRITNEVLEKKLKSKIHISSVMYYVIDGVMTINVRYRRVEDYKEFGFSYSYYEVKRDQYLMDHFECFIDNLFEL